MSLNDKLFNRFGSSGALNDRLYQATGGLSFVESGSVEFPIDLITDQTEALFSPKLLFPAGSLSEGSNMVYVDAFLRKSGGNAGWSPFINFGFGEGKQTLNWTLNATDDIFFRLNTIFTVSLGKVTGGWLAPGASIAGAIVDYEGDIDNSKDQWLQFGVRNGNILDVYHLIAYSVYVNS